MEAKEKTIVESGKSSVAVLIRKPKKEKFIQSLEEVKREKDVETEISEVGVAAWRASGNVISLAASGTNVFESDKNIVFSKVTPHNDSMSKVVVPNHIAKNLEIKKGTKLKSKEVSGSIVYEKC